MKWLESDWMQKFEKGGAPGLGPADQTRRNAARSLAASAHAREPFPDAPKELPARRAYPEAFC
jgi:hypothetical protein